MAGLLTAVETLIQCNDFSLAPATCETVWELSLPSRNPNVPSPHDSQANETDPVRRGVHRLYRLEQLEKQAENLSLYTNNAYHAVGLAYKEAVEVRCLYPHMESPSVITFAVDRSQWLTQIEHWSK